MLEGFHTIKSGFSDNFDPMTPRLHRMDNGNFKSNFFLRDVELIPQNNETGGGNQDDLGQTSIFFVIATTRAGALPATATGGDLTNDNFDLRLSDARQIAWGVIQPNYGYSKIVIDPGHIIVDDIYVNAWSFSSGGTLQNPDWSLGYMLHLQNVVQDGKAGLISTARQSAVE